MIDDALETVLRKLATGGDGAIALASVICGLVKEGAELGALQDVPLRGIDGAPRSVKVIPPEWFKRLSRAIELGVFDHPHDRTVRKTIDRILAPPLPEHVE